MVTIQMQLQFLSMTSRSATHHSHFVMSAVHGEITMSTRDNIPKRKTTYDNPIYRHTAILETRQR